VGGFVENKSLRLWLRGWEHMRFRYCTASEWESAPPTHRFTHPRTGKFILAESCSLCPDHRLPEIQEDQRP
jgi:hypothetical protein